jgi:hypothetical protein
MVGAERFELPTLCSQSRCATRLRYAPTYLYIIASSRVLRLLQPMNIRSKERVQ